MKAEHKAYIQSPEFAALLTDLSPEPHELRILIARAALGYDIRIAPTEEEETVALLFSINHEAELKELAWEITANLAAKLNEGVQ